jgi:hypothetical protein
MDDPWWPGFPPTKPQLRQVECGRDSPPPAGAGSPSVWFPVLGIMWLASGPWFLDNASHFGPGFLPMLVWLATFPFAALVFPASAIAQYYRFKDGTFGVQFRVWRLAIWIVAGVSHVGAVVFVLASWSASNAT